MKTLDVCCIGKLNVDFSFTVERIEVGENHISDSLYVSLGGKATNVAVALSKLGIKASMIASIGDDWLSNYALQQISEFQVNFHPIIKSGVRTGQTFVIIEESGRNTMFNYLGANSLLSAADIKNFETIICSSELVYFQTGMDTSILEYLITLGVPIFVEVSHPVDLELLKHAFAISMNESEALVLTSSVNVHEALEKLTSIGVKRVFLKVGDRGSYCAGLDGLIFKEAFKVDVVDTTGAGDSFSAGCIYGLLKKLPWEAILEFANACGAITCTRIGTTNAFPTLEEVRKFLEAQKR